MDELKNDYDDLKLNTPTLIREDDNVEIWATRSENGGTVEHRVKPDSEIGRFQRLRTHADDANYAFMDLKAPSIEEAIAQVRNLTWQIQSAAYGWSDPVLLEYVPTPEKASLFSKLRRKKTVTDAPSE